MSSPDINLVSLAVKHLDESLARLEEGLRSVYEAQAELGRTLITLASGALVLSVSVVQFLSEKGYSPHWTWLLPTAWILFGLTVLVGASRQGWLGTARSMRWRLEAQRGEIRERMAALQHTSDLSKNFDDVIVGALESAAVEPDNAATVFNRLTVAMYWFFALGLIALLVFAIRNLPW